MKRAWRKDVMYGDRDFIKMVVPESVIEGVALPAELRFAIDSRHINRGDIFVALPGNNVDGHAFVADAIAKGAAGVMIDRDKKKYLDHLDEHMRKKISIILVPRTYAALITMAKAWRTQFTYPVVGVTGSVGKTTTKEYLAAILRTHGMNCLVSQGTQNTALGCALTILRMRQEHTVAVFEMGISKQGEMLLMADLVRPTTAIITSIGHSHLEGLGSLPDVATEKRAIFSFFKQDNIGIINGDQAALSTISYSHPSIKFGCKTTNQVQARKIRSTSNSISFFLKIYNERYPVTLPINHVGNVNNALAAGAAAHHLGIPHATIVRAIMQPLVVESRFQHKSLGKRGVVIDDAYNASPESMKAALLAFEKCETKDRKIAVLGDMLELGVNTSFWHRQLGRLLRKVPSIQHVILVGNHVQWTKKTAPLGLSLELVPTWQEAQQSLQKQLHLPAVVLVKGSNSMGLKHLVHALVNYATSST
jgi:UDP-N-acetylmuramoyl-tripeptide--D-alanyl-D-alanine ligase